MDTPTPAKPPAPGMCRGLAPTSVKEAEASIRLTISAGNGVAAQRDAEHLLSTVVAGDRALVLNALAHLHAANGDVLALGCIAAEARGGAQLHGDADSDAEAILHAGHALQMIEDHAATIKYFVDAEQLATRIGVRDLEARIWWRMGVSSSLSGRHAPSVDYLDRGVLAFRAPGNTVDRLAARSSLLNTYNR